MYISQIYSRTIRGTVLNGELYAQRLQKLIYLELTTEANLSENLFRRLERNFQETVCKQIQIN